MADTEILTPRAVPLGGSRTMTVCRTLPQRSRSLIGPRCFAYRFGPDHVTATGGTNVPGIRTRARRRPPCCPRSRSSTDSTGFANMVKTAEVDLMIAESGISHSEFSTPATRFQHDPHYELGPLIGRREAQLSTDAGVGMTPADRERHRGDVSRAGLCAAGIRPADDRRRW